MTLIKIKFNSEMERAIIEGRKCCTTRDEIKGNIGDLFRVKDRMYRIIQVDESDLFYSSAMANAEGFKVTPFTGVWVEIRLPEGSMRILNGTTELQIRLRPDEVDGFIDLVLGATHSQFRRELIDGMKRECLL